MGVVDFFISYAAADEKWAEWVGFVLEEDEKYSVRLQKWDFGAGSNFVLEMQRAASESSRTIGILSPDYLSSKFVKPEWAGAFAKDPEGRSRSLVLVRVRPCEPSGMIKPLVYIDLVGLEEKQASERLLSGVSGKRAKPSKRPQFPGAQQHARTSPDFPGVRASARGGDHPTRHMPRVRRTPTDLEKRRFLQAAFDVVVHHFEECLRELAAQGESVECDFKKITATKCAAEIFVNGRSHARCKFWIAGEMGGEGIKYSETGFNWDQDNSFNEVLSIRDDELTLHALMKDFGGQSERDLDLERLTPEGAAEYLWRRFTWRLG